MINSASFWSLLPPAPPFPPFAPDVEVKPPLLPFDPLLLLLFAPVA
jgi:hypothetical protein